MTSFIIYVQHSTNCFKKLENKTTTTENTKTNVVGTVTRIYQFQELPPNLFCTITRYTSHTCDPGIRILLENFNYKKLFPDSETLNTSARLATNIKKFSNALLITDGTTISLFKSMSILPFKTPHKIYFRY